LAFGTCGFASITSTPEAYSGYITLRLGHRVTGLWLTTYLSFPQHGNMGTASTDADLRWKSITHSHENILKASETEGLPTMLMMHGAKPQFTSVSTGDGSTAKAASQSCKEKVDRNGISKTVVETYALHLGLDLEEDQELLWIAEQALLAPLPPHWTEVLTQTEVTAFQNILTGVISWKHPLEDHFRTMYQYHKAALREAATVKVPTFQPFRPGFL